MATQMVIRNGKIVVGKRPCGTCSGSGTVATKTACGTCGSTGRGPRGGRGRRRACHGSGSHWDQEQREPSPRCEGANAREFERGSLYDPLPGELWSSHPVGVYPGTWALPLASDYPVFTVRWGKAWSLRDGELLEDVRQERSPSAIAVCREDGALCDHIGVFRTRAGFAVWALFRNAAGQSVARSKTSNRQRRRRRPSNAGAPWSVAVPTFHRPCLSQSQLCQGHRQHRHRPRQPSRPAAADRRLDHAVHRNGTQVHREAPWIGQDRAWRMAVGIQRQRIVGLELKAVRPPAILLVQQGEIAAREVPPTRFGRRAQAEGLDQGSPNRREVNRRGKSGRGSHAQNIRPGLAGANRGLRTCPDGWRMGPCRASRGCTPAAVVGSRTPRETVRQCQLRRRLGVLRDSASLFCGQWVLSR